jgi:hypothetical protein
VRGGVRSDDTPGRGGEPWGGFVIDRPTTGPRTRFEEAGMSDEKQDTCQNTDREIWREKPGDYYADSIHVTEHGAVGINCGGSVRVMSARAWHKLAESNDDRIKSLESSLSSATAKVEGLTKERDRWNKQASENFDLAEGYRSQLTAQGEAVARARKALSRFVCHDCPKGCINTVCEEALGKPFRDLSALPSPSPDPRDAVVEAAKRVSKTRAGTMRYMDVPGEADKWADGIKALVALAALDAKEKA